MRVSSGLRYSVMAKIMTIVTVCIGFVVAASGVGIYQIRKIGQEIEFIAEADVPLADAIGHVTSHRLEQALLTERLLRMRLMQRQDEAERLAETEARFSYLTAKIYEEFAEALEIARKAMQIAQTPAQTAEFEAIYATLSRISEENTKFAEVSQKALEHARMGNTLNAASMLHEVEDSQNKSNWELEELLFKVQALSETAAKAAVMHEWDAIRFTVLISLGSAILSVLLAMVLGRKSIARPMLDVVNALKRLSRNDFDVELPTRRNDEIGDIGRAFDSFKEHLIQMQAQEKQEIERQQALNREIKLLSELNEWLQSSNSLDELFTMVSKFLTMLLPRCSGAIYVYSNSRDVLDGACSWNGASLEAHIRPDSCWGLRRGRPYVHGDHLVSFDCEHVPGDGDDRAYICLPILAHGETVGLMHLTPAANVDNKAFFAQRKLAQMAAEQVSLAIANTRMRDELHHQSIRDPLTGLFNRRHFIEMLRKSIERSKHSGQPVSLVSIDVDHFKKFNDNHGHDAGDMVLRAVGSTLEQACDGDQLPCRLGGEEFMVLLPETSADKGAEIAEELREAIEAIHVRYGEKTLPRITISAGVASHPDHGQMPQDLMKSADDALYASKAGGRNMVTIADRRNGVQLEGIAAIGPVDDDEDAFDRDGDEEEKSTGAVETEAAVA